MKIVCKKNYLIFDLKKYFENIEISSEYDNDAIILIDEPNKITRDNLCLMPNLKLCISSRDGIETVDKNYLEEKGIRLCNAHGVYSKAISEFIVMRIIEYSLNAYKYDKQQIDCIYKTISERKTLENYTIGFLGTGSIAQETARKLKIFNCNIIGYKRSTLLSLANFDKLYYSPDLNKFIDESDILVITVDLNKNTYHLIDEKRLNLLKDKAIINVARGAVIDEECLTKKLKNNYIKYAALDVFEKEPLDKNSKLWELDNVKITPHISGIANDNHKLLSSLVVKIINQFLNNEILENEVKLRR